MFPTTIWSTILQAGDSDGEALQRFALRYRPVIRDYIRRRGFSEGDSEDLCQDVFVRLLRGEVLGKAEPSKGRFRSLLLAVTTHVIYDRLRKRRESTSVAVPQQHDDLQEEHDSEFDRGWIIHLAEAAMQRLEQEGSPYFEVLRDHLSGISQDRKRLWVARRKLIALIRHEVAMTCNSHDEFEQEVRYLSGFLCPAEKSAKNHETTLPAPR